MAVSLLSWHHTVRSLLSDVLATMAMRTARLVRFLHSLTRLFRGPIFINKPKLNASHLFAVIILEAKWSTCDKKTGELYPKYY